MKDEPAYPQTYEGERYIQRGDNISERVPTVESHGGLTKREYFAGLAMQGLLAAVYSDKNMLREFCKVDKVPRPRGVGESEYINGTEAITANALSYADALIKELEK